MSTFTLRLPDHIMRDAKTIAERSGTSLDQLFLAMISERIGAIKALEVVERRPERADVTRRSPCWTACPMRPPPPAMSSKRTSRPARRDLRPAYSSASCPRSGCGGRNRSVRRPGPPRAKP